MKCPDCQAPLLIVEYRGVEIDLCSVCGGCWLDAEELGFLLQGEFRRPEELDDVRGAAGRRRCPLCGKRLRAGPLAQTRIEVDVCSMGHGLWLDRGELRDLLAAHERDPGLLPLTRYLRDMFAESSESSENKPSPASAGRIQ